MTATLPVDRFAERTLPALLLATVRRGPGRVFVHSVEQAGAPPRPVSFALFRDWVSRLARALGEVGVGPTDRVLLLAENCPEWPAVALATHLRRAEPAGLFASLGPAPVQEIATRVKPRVIFVSGASQWAKLSPIAAELVAAGLGAVISLEPLGPDAAPAGVTVLGREVFDTGAELAPQELEARAGAVQESDPFLLLFTSGTTGRQKGVRLTQRTIVHAIDCGAAAVKSTADDLGLHLLPFGHVAGHDQFWLALGQGHSLVMTAKRELLPASLALRPTYLFAVPLIYDRIRGAVLEKLAGLPGPVRALATAGLDAAARVRVDGSRRLADRALTAVADLTVGRALTAQLGGRVRGVFAGGAPVPAPLFRFFEGLGLPFFELYGMTETAGLVAMNVYGQPRRFGSVGLLSPYHQVRLADDGELQLKGPLLFSGYLEPEDDLDAFTPDGFYRTGDLASLGADGALSITGRRKALLVLSTGKKIAPEPIEAAIGAAEPFRGAVVLGEGQAFVSAVVFVEPGDIAKAEAGGRRAAEALLPRVHAALRSFSEHERPKRLIVVAGAPAEHAAFITPSHKLKRDAVLASLASQVAELYRR